MSDTRTPQSNYAIPGDFLSAGTQPAMAPNMNDGPDTAQGQDLAGGQAGARDVTRLLHAWSGGDERAAERLTELVYAQVRAIAGKHLRQFGNQLTLQPTELAHELFLRLIGTETNCSTRASSKPHRHASSSASCRRRSTLTPVIRVALRLTRRRHIPGERA
jgi:hypothetical protein